MPGKALVVDANILVRAVLGKRVREMIGTYCEEVSFFVPEAAYADAEEHLPRLVIRHGGDPETALALLRSLSRLVVLIGSDVYGEFEAEARERLGQRDPRGLADSGFRIGASLSNLDGRHRLLRMWSGPMDFQPRSGVSAGVMTHRPPRASRCQAHHIPRGDSSSIRGAGTVLLCTRLRAAGRRR